MPAARQRPGGGPLGAHATVEPPGSARQVPSIVFPSGAAKVHDAPSCDDEQACTASGGGWPPGGGPSGMHAAASPRGPVLHLPFN